MSLLRGVWDHRRIIATLRTQRLRALEQVRASVESELHQREAVKEKISLSDRFGLCLRLHPFEQTECLAVARHRAAMPLQLFGTAILRRTR